MFRFAGFHITLFEQDIYIPALVIFAVCAAIIALMIYFNLKKRRYHSASIKYSDKDNQKIGQNRPPKTSLYSACSEDIGAGFVRRRFRPSAGRDREP